MLRLVGADDDLGRRQFRQVDRAPEHGGDELGDLVVAELVNLRRKRQELVLLRATRERSRVLHQSGDVVVPGNHPHPG